MKVYHDIKQLPAFKNAVITIGTFDGVHQGHQQIIRQLLKEASAVDGTAVVITFFPHPKLVVGKEKADTAPIYLLNTPEEKYALLHAHGLEHVVVVPFDTAFAMQPADAYIKDFLVNYFHPHTIIIGYDHRFGKNRQGDYRLLEEKAEVYDYTVQEIPEHVLKDVTISSTKVRSALLAGDNDTAAAYLGYRYFFSGTVIMGNQLGRTIGYPTANLHIDNAEKLVPANGVYAVEIVLSERVFGGMMNIGVRPTVDGTTRVIEVNIFDFNEQIYGSILKVTLIKKLRSEIKFTGLEALKEQLALDQVNALAVLTI